MGDESLTAAWCGPLFLGTSNGSLRQHRPSELEREHAGHGDAAGCSALDGVFLCSGSAEWGVRSGGISVVLLLRALQARLVLGGREASCEAGRLELCGHELGKEDPRMPRAASSAVCS